MFRIILLTALLLATPAVAKQWYDGGTLHSSRLNEWKAASFANRLATAGDFTAKIFGATKVRRLGGIDAIRPYAIELKDCIDESAKANVNMKTSETAASCAVIMGWA